MGGGDSDGNYEYLTVEEHAEAHRKLYEKHGHFQDLLAWKGLSGQIGKEELIRQHLSESGKKGIRARKSTNRGKKYNWTSKPGGKNFKPVGTGGLKWFHDPMDPTKKGCFKNEADVPESWIRGQGRKAINPGRNFHTKRSSF